MTLQDVLAAVEHESWVRVLIEPVPEDMRILRMFRFGFDFGEGEEYILVRLPEAYRPDRWTK
jgi:hypothetical protein